MKTSTMLKTGMALVIVASLSMNTFAIGYPPASVPTAVEESFDVSMKLKVRPNMDTYVWVFDEAGNEVHADKVSKDAEMGKLYDFSQLDNGVYTLMTKTEQKSVAKTFEVKNGALVVLEEEKQYRPVFSLDGDILSISYLNLDEKQISLALESKSSQHLEEVGGNDMMYGKRLNIKKLPKGEYSVALTAGIYTYNYFFIK
jgi:hypothetical protein